MKDKGTTDKFWMVWREGHAGPTVKHAYPSTARQEADRLASKHTGERFVVLQSMSLFVATINPPQELKCIKQEAPF